MCIRDRNYSVIPLRISSVLGGVSAAGGFLAAIMIAIRKLINPTVMVGWSSTICAIVVFSGLILMVLGIIGEYLGKMILILNRTPQYIVRETDVYKRQTMDIPMREQNPTTSLYHIKPASTNTFREPAMSR